MLRSFRSIPVRAFSTSRLALQSRPEQGVSKLKGEPGNVQQVQNEIVSGAPSSLSTERVVRIYQQAKPATQSGTHGTVSWRLDWDVLNRANRWENDMMGWPSSGDYMQATQIKFRTKEDAIRFAANQGWDYYVQEPHQRHFRVKQYAMNFEHSKGKLKHIRTK